MKKWIIIVLAILFLIADIIVGSIYYYNNLELTFDKSIEELSIVLLLEYMFLYQ